MTAVPYHYPARTGRRGACSCGTTAYPCRKRHSEAQLTAQSPPGLPAELADWPACTLSETQLGELELLTSGMLAPLRGFMDAADAATVHERGMLADGTPWPIPVTLDLPADMIPPGADHLVLQDPEGSPLAVLSITERLPAPGPEDPAAPRLVRLAGPVQALREPEHGPFRQLRRRPAEVRAELSAGTGSSGNVLAYATRRPLNKRHIGQLRHFAGQLNARLLVLPLITGPALVVRRPEALVRAVLAAGEQLPAGTLVIPVPLAPRQAGPDPAAADLRAQAVVAAALGATHPLAHPHDPTPAPAPRARPPRAERGVAIFFTGLSGSGKSTIARGLAAALTERGDRTVSLLDGDHVRHLLSAGLTFSRADRDLNIARIGYVAAEVARHGGIAICAPIAPYAQARATARDMV